jgi:DNA-directed RNA polymerase specialized sigma24 family protein
MPDADVDVLWARWRLTGSRADAANLIETLRPWVWKRCLKWWMSGDHPPLVTQGSRRSRPLNDANDLVNECLMEILKGRSTVEYINAYLDILAERVYDRLVLRREYDRPPKRDRKTGELVSRGNKVFHLDYNGDDDGDDEYATQQAAIAAEIEGRWSGERGLRDLPTRDLNGRRRAVAELLQLGLKKSQIASRLKMSKRTVERVAGRSQRKAVVPEMNATAQYAVRFRVIVLPTLAQRVLLHNMQYAMAA